MELEGGREAFYEKEEAVQSVDNELKKQITNIKNVIYEKIVIGYMPNDSKDSQKTDNAIFYEYIVRRLCLDLDPSINVSNAVPFDELPQTNSIIKQLRDDKEIGPLINALVQTYRALSKSENATYNKRYIEEALINYPWPYHEE